MSSVKSDASKQCPSCTGKYSSSFEFNHLQIDPVSHDKTLRHTKIRSRPRLSQSLGTYMDKMQSLYESLTGFLSDATVSPEVFDKLLSRSQLSS